MALLFKNYDGSDEVLYKDYDSVNPPIVGSKVIIYDMDKPSAWIVKEVTYTYRFIQNIGGNQLITPVNIYVYVVSTMRSKHDLQGVRKRSSPRSAD